MLRTIFILILSVFVMHVGCKRQNMEDEETQGSFPVVSVHAEKIIREDIPVSITVTGKTDVLKKEKILSPTSGKIVSLNVLEYQSIHEGDIIAIVRSKESQAAIDGARTLIQSAESQKQKAEAEKALALATEHESNTVLRSPISGIISSRNVTEGEFVPENSELFTIIDPSTIYFVADVPLHDIDQIHVGQSSRIRFSTNRDIEFDGTVDAMSPQSDLESQTVALRIRFAHLSSEMQQKLRPDISGTATIVTGVHRNAFLIPKSALIRNDETNSYFIVTVLQDSLSQTIAVHVGASTDSTVEIMNNELRPGMMIVTEGNYTLADSTKVTILP